MKTGWALAFHATLATGASAAALAAWKLPKSSIVDEVVVVSVPKDTLSAIEWEEADRLVRLSREESGLRVTVQAKKSDATAPEAEPELYPGSDKAKEVWESLATLKAGRDLGVPAQDMLSALGLESPKTFLRIFGSSAPLALSIGDGAYGTGDTYLARQDGHVFLVPASTLSPLRHGATALQDRLLFGVKADDIQRVSIEREGEREREGTKGRRELLHRRASGGLAKASFYADPADPETPVEGAKSWIDRVLNLRAGSLLTEAPKGPADVVVELQTDSGARTTVSLWAVAAPAGAEALANATSTRFAKPIHVATTTVEQLLSDVGKVLNP